VFNSMGLCTRCGHQHDEAVCLRCRQSAPLRTWMKTV
jgi:hypothetical protein